MKKGGVDPSLLGLVGPLTKIARAMSSQWNVEIIPSGFACMTDGKTIYIPFTSDYLPEEQRHLLHGMLDHEVCHVVEENEHIAADRATPMTIIKSEKSKTLRMLFNVVEDVRIEIKWSKVYPGVAENLNSINQEMAKAWEKKPEERKNFWDRLGCAFILRARGIEPTWVGEATLAALDAVGAELEESKTIRWGQDSYDLAERIYRKLKDDAEDTIERDKEAKSEKKKGESKGKKPKVKIAKGEPMPTGDGEEGEDAGGPEDGDEVMMGEDGEDGSGHEVEAEGDMGGPESDGDEEEPSGGGDSSGGEEVDEESDGEDSKSGGKPDEEEAEPTEDEVAAAKEAIASEPSTEDLMDEMKGGLEKGVRADAKAHRRYVPDHSMKKLDKWFKAEPTTDADANYKKARADVNAQIGAIRGKQLAYIQTITRKRLVPNQDAGRLDTQRLASVRTGATDVFNFIKKGRNLDTCFELLLDLSGSMGSGDNKGSAAYYAKRTAIALAEPWDSLRIPFEMIGFSNNHARGGYYHDADPESVCRCPFDFFIFKGWNERLAQCRPRFSAIRGYHDNADGEAVHAAACRLAVRPEKRKILVVVSDGLPCHSGIDCGMLNEHLKATVRQITKAGIEVIGVGAGTDAPAKFYNKSTGASNMIITDLNKLATTLFTTLRDRMLK